MGIGTTSPQNTFVVSNAGAEGLEIAPTGGTPNVIAFNRSTAAYAPLTLNGSVHILQTSGTERVRIDSSGRLLVGTSSSVGYGSLLQVVGGDTARPQIHRNVNDQYPPIIYFSKARGTASQSVSSGDELGQIAFVGYDGTGQVVAASIDGLVDGTPGANDMPGRLVFSVTADGAASPTERMRIRADGIVSINRGGTASPTADPQQFYIGEGGTNQFAIMVMQTGGNAGGSRDYIRFYNYLNQLTGSINHNGTTTVSYNTSSDYRLKENIEVISNAVERIQELKPCRFNFISEPEKVVDGFIAHEVQEIVPEAINGEKDGVDDEGNPVYQGIDQSKLVPLLTAALQEAIGRIEALETEVTALKAQ
jgi:hypothetical protein